MGWSCPVRRRTGRHGEAGFSTLEAVIVLPVVVVLSMLVVQMVMVWHARTIAEAAARDGLRVARGYQATGPQGQAAAQQYLDIVAGPMLTARSVTAQRGPATVVVTVHATVMSVVPFGSFHVDEQATGPVEFFQPGQT